MMVNLLLIFVLINITICQAHLQSNYALNTVLEQTTNFFEKLKSDYASKNLSEDVLTKINGKVTEYIKNASEVIFTRHKRELPEDSNKGINILNGFQNFDQLNFNNARDINLFSLRNELQSTWFAAVLDASKVSFYQISNYTLHHVAVYPLTNGRQIIVNSCDYGALLIVRNEDDSILILRFTKDRENYCVYRTQDFESNNMTHLAIWHGMNQLYLGVASHSNISIYTWFGDYFDSVQVINHGTRKLIPFYSKGFMYLATTGSTTLIFKYFLKSNEFAVTQRLPASQDISSFELREGHFTEHFLTLSSESFIVIYKEIHDRFVPFQQISAGRSVVPIISNKAILLLFLYKDTMLTYQYDGWRFVELNIKLPEVHQSHHVILYGKELLLVQHKNDTWALKQPIWTKKKSYKNLQEEIRAWNINAMNTTQRTVEEILDLKKPIKILRGHIDQLFVHNINEHNSDALKDVSKQYKKVVSKLQEQKVILSTKWHSNNLTLTSLHAKNIRVKCKTMCKVNRLNVEENTNLLSKLKPIRNENRTLSFKALRVKEIKNWKCPLFSLPIENIIVDRSINGILLDDLQKNVLKVIGDQEVSGEHTFLSMNVTDAFLPLDVASNSTKQEIQAREIIVRKFNLTEGGILLPFNSPSTIITGSIKASKVKVKGSIRLQGGLSGKWAKRLAPLTVISESIILDRDLILENAKIENLTAHDLIANKAGSVKDVLSNAVPLSDNISVPLILLGEKMKWSNVTLHSLQNWITANSPDKVTISGKKHILHNVEVPRSTYNNLKLPEIETPLCGTTVIALEVKTTMLAVNNMTVKGLKSSRVFGNLGKRSFTRNSMFESFDWTSERYYHNIIARNVSVTHMNSIDLIELKRLANSWITSDVLKSSIEATNLVVETLQPPVQFRIELPKVTGNMISEQNTFVGSINNVNLVDFLANAVELEDMISLGNITFGNGFTTNHIYISHFLLNLTQSKENPNLHKKRISGNIETNAIYLPYSFAFAKSDVPSNIVVKGSVTFPIEPTILNINKIKLEELFTRIWMTTNATVFHGSNLHIVNALINGSITLNSSLNTLNLETWRNMSGRVLSKTRSQGITVVASLNNIETPVVIGSNSSAIKSSVSDFNDMFDNALVKYKQQEVKAKWTFNKLKVIGKLHAKRKINNMNLKTDVMRYDSKESIVTGKKTVEVLSAENLNGLNFDKWAGNALMQKQKFVIIKGRKSFNTVSINSMNLSGTIMGQNIKEALSKSANQTIYGQKTIQGSVNASILVIDGLVNDVNLTDLINHQLKKQKPFQRIKTRIELQKALKIVGNLTIDGSYGKAKLKNSYKTYSNAIPVAEKMREYSKTVETINVALRNRAVYINKLEVVKEMNVTDTSNGSIRLQQEQCKTKNSSRLCANKHVVNVIKANSSDFILIKSILLDENEFIVWIKFDSVSVYLYNNIEKNLSHLKDLHIPKIIDAFVESVLHSLWIVLRLTSQTLVLHYQPWEDLQEYVLPVTDVFTLSRSPNDQLLLLLSDGVWNLEGLASPRNIIEIPLKEEVETFTDGANYYVKCGSKNNTALMKARYVGN